MLPKVTIYRSKSRDDGTIGMVFGPHGFRCYSLELPDRDNRQNISRIPAGEYACTFNRSARYKKLMYLVKDVEGRRGVRIHSGNWAGDTNKGYKTHVQGCILLGEDFTLDSNGQLMLTASRKAIRRFQETLSEEDFLLIIKD